MTSALRKKILSLAIRGKLVPQDPSDEPASVLLERIRTERAANESATPPRGRGRRSSSDNPPCPKRGVEPGTAVVTDPPFPIPESWVWTTLGEVCVILDHKRKPVTRKDRTPGPFPYYGATGVQDFVAGFIFDEPLVLLGEDGARWGAGESSAYVIAGKTWVNNHAHVLRVNKLTVRDWIAFVLNALDLTRFVTCTTVPKLNQENTRIIPIPLPPLAEQKRIVARLDELKSLCDGIDEGNTALRGLAARAKARILDLAIRGALVPQDPANEPTSALLSRIRATADKPPCPKQPPFDIPATWAWTTLESIGEVIRGSGIKRSEISTSGKPCIRYGEIYTTYYLETQSVVSRIPPALFNASKHASPRSIVMTLTGEDRKDIAKTIAYLGEDEIAISGDMLCVCPREVEPLYLSFVLNSPWAIERKGRLATGDLVIHISAKTMSEFPIPLSPLAEQRRIVAKVKELFAAIDQTLG